MRRILLGFLVGAILWLSCQRVSVEYPSFPQTKEGRELRHFLKGVRVVALAVEPPTADVWGQDSDVSQAFLRIVPAKIFQAFSEDSYFKMVDLSKRADIIDEASLSLTGITNGRAKLGELLGVEAILYISVAKPVYECSLEMRADYMAMGMLILQAAANANSNNRRGHRRSSAPIRSNNDPVLKPTGVRKLLLPIEATLVRVDTGESKKAVISKPSTIYNSVGATSCPALLESLSQALTEVIPEMEIKLSPKAETKNIRIFTDDDDPEIAFYLSEGYEEIKGDTPSFNRAKLAWEKADAKSAGKSWAAKANLATYYFSQGDFEKAAELYDSAIKLGSNKKGYLKDLSKIASSAAEAIEE
ncbi:tetratricopeptide repeat protein [Leptospira inadai serovar Lyme str. 10]|uniref:Tetratricopeptide repeat protein n=2 Tax=Leptospira inadai serovar Lyme TaxID=293084 RepID=V6HEK1_9LEPT|nr:lipoprotein LipL41 [Leptospira inadai]EQA38821.1 tetratricopeptide repeat protein [Leptospira inadai serovar Lyme str. 10]PNV74060.1 lipoprotein LipL41 [Leptospira inadai serovar Lyme]